MFKYCWAAPIGKEKETEDAKREVTKGAEGHKMQNTKTDLSSFRKESPCLELDRSKRVAVSAFDFQS